MEGVDRVAQAADLAHLLKQPRRHPAAEHAGEHLQAEQIGIALRQAVHRQRHVRLFEVAVLDMRAADETGRLRRRRRRAFEGGEPALGFGDHRRVIDRACRHHQHVRRPVVARQIGGKLLAIE